MRERFKPYQESDYQDLKNMIIDLYDEDPEGEPINECKLNNTINEFQKNPQKIQIYLFKEGDENIGYAILVYFWSNEYGGNILTIDELYVMKKYRGKKVATEFFSYVASFENVVLLSGEI